MQRNPQALAIYIHYPYCIQKCRYCDFYSVAGKDSAETLDLYLAALGSEFEERRRDFSAFSRIESIFFGGSTASRLPPGALSAILGLIEESFSFLPGIEITLEGNPEDFSETYLEGLAAAGINRVNAGIQTFDPQILDRLGRFYDPVSYPGILERLRSVPLRRGIDLIYGYPDSASIFEDDLARVLSADLEHLSLYALTVEKGTELERVGPYPDEELQAQLFAELPARLAREGYIHYEVSNFARAGFESRHNLRYWLYEPYMGLGPGAHGFTGQLRYANPRNADRYLKGHFSRTMSRAMPEVDIWLGLLRLVRFPLSVAFEILEEANLPRDPFLDQLELWIRQEVVRVQDGYFCWQSRGLLFLDQYIECMISVYSGATVTKTESR